MANEKFVTQYGVRYSIKNNLATVLGYDATSVKDSFLKIPDTIEGHAVRYIAENAFCNVADLERVELPKTCINIGRNAFKGCTDLVTVTINHIPKMARIDIGEQAFASCINLRFVDAGDSYLWVGNEAFLNCEALDFVLGKLFEVGEKAFHNCVKASGLTVANNAHLSSKTFGKTQPKAITIEGRLSRPSKVMFQQLKNTKIICTDLFPYWDLAYEGYCIQKL